jgi:hypothetical protein
MSKTAERDLDAWDAEIEEDFRRAVAATKTAGRHKHGRRHVGFPWTFFVDVCRLTRGSHAALTVILYIYRRTKVCNSLTVTLPGSELAELGIDRRRKHEVLAKLRIARLIQLEKATGQSTKVTLTWQLLTLII